MHISMTEYHYFYLKVSLCPAISRLSQNPFWVDHNLATVSLCPRKPCRLRRQDQRF